MNLFQFNYANNKCENALSKSKSFLSKHLKDNLGKHSSDFIRISRGYYKMNSSNK